MYYLLVRAYYDLYRTFDGIDNTFFGSQLTEDAARENITLIEYCSRCLGYSSDDYCSATKRMQTRAAAVDYKSAKKLDLFQDMLKTKAELKAHNLQPHFVKKQIECDDKYRDMVCTITNFIEHTDMISLCDKETLERVPLSHLFLELKSCSDAAALEEKIPKYIKPVVAIIATADVAPESEYSYAAGGKLMFSTGDYDLDKLVIDVCLHLGRKAFVMPPEHYYFVINNMLYYQLAESDKSQTYLKMVDLMNIYDMAMVDLLRFTGLTFINQFEIYKTSGFFIYPLPDSRYLCVDPFNPGKRIELDCLQLSSAYDSERGRINA